MPDPSTNVRDAHYRQLNAYRDDPAYKALDGDEDRIAFFATQIGHKWEIDAALYDEFLDLLPPLGHRADSFYLSEFLFDDITHRFTREGERYFCEVAYYPPRPSGRAEAAPASMPAL
jgi:hypothetical protein